jgi:hypothetical protein
MTNKQYFNLWAEFRAEMFGCKPDKNGNCPCDYGMPCDKCQTDEAWELFKKKWKGKKEEIKQDKGYRVYVTDSTVYEFNGNYTKEAAVEQALEWFAERKPTTLVEKIR